MSTMLPRALTVAVIGAALGWAGSHALILGYWTLAFWGAAGLGVGYWMRGRGALLPGASYGFTLSFVFMLAGYTGAAPAITRVPFFGLLGLFGAGCGSVLAALGARLARAGRASA